MVRVWREQGIEKAPGKDDADVVEEAFVEGEIGLNEEAERVEDGALDDGGGGVEIAGVEGRGTGEIDLEALIGLGEGQVNGKAVVEIFGGLG